MSFNKYLKESLGGLSSVFELGIEDANSGYKTTRLFSTEEKAMAAASQELGNEITDWKSINDSSIGQYLAKDAGSVIYTIKTKEVE